MFSPEIKWLRQKAQEIDKDLICECWGKLYVKLID